MPLQNKQVIRFSMPEELRSEVESVKAELVAQIEAAQSENQALDKEKAELTALRDSLVLESTVPPGSAPLSHDQAVLIAAARIRIDSINARLTDIDQTLRRPPIVDVDNASGVLRDLCALWSEQTSEVVHNVLSVFEPREFVRGQFIALLASEEILQRCKNGTFTIYKDVGAATRIIKIFDRFLEGRPYLGDDWQPQENTVAQEASTA